MITSNEENIAVFYPQQDKREALAKVETDYLNYIKNEFFSSEGNAYVIYESDNMRLPSLRLYRLRKDSIILRHWRHTRNIEGRAMVRVCLPDQWIC